jgi:hypothetical protein
MSSTVILSIPIRITLFVSQSVITMQFVAPVGPEGGSPVIKSIDILAQIH